MTTDAHGAVGTDELRTIPTFADLAEEDLAWLASRMTRMDAEAGTQFVVPGEPALHMYALFEGLVIGQRAQLGPNAPVFELRGPMLSGLLPFSRMTHFGGTLRASTPVRAARLHRDDFPAMLQRMPQLEARFVAAIADRVRESTLREDQHARLVQLGRLAAGLAHELGNPAAALARVGTALDDGISELTAACTLLAGRPEGAARLAELARVAAVPVPADPLARADAEEQLGDALHGLGVPNAFRVAPDLVEAGLSGDAVLEVLRELPPDARAPVVQWTAARFTTRRLLAELADAVTRIRDIVGSVKVYAHMDRAPSAADVDVRLGLRSTLTLLGHRARAKGLSVVDHLPADLPAVTGFPGELNQVWTNLLDNAIDALPDGGTLVVRAVADATHVHVDVEDDGPGIPPDVLPRIFDAFFTTKPAGQGTGLGLDIARLIVERTHGGSLTVESRPGRTVFRVSLHRAAAA